MISRTKHAKKKSSLYICFAAFAFNNQPQMMCFFYCQILGLKVHALGWHVASAFDDLGMTLNIVHIATSYTLNF